MSNFRLYGMAQAYTFVAALQAAGKDLTREGIVKAIEDKGADFEGPWLAPLDYSEDSHRGISGVSVGQLQGTAYKELAPVQTTDAATPPSRSSTASRRRPTENGLPDADSAAHVRTA